MAKENNKFFDVPYTLYSSNGVEMVKFIFVNDLLSKIMPEYNKFFPYPNKHIEWQERCEIIEDWISQNNAHYYFNDNKEIDATSIFSDTIKNNKDSVVIDIH